MSLTKKIIYVCLSAITLLPGIGAMKSSISVPESLYAHDCTTIGLNDSPYELEQTSERIVREDPHTPIDKTTGDTAVLCYRTFSRIYTFLCDPQTPADCFYIAVLSNYMEVLRKINHILFNVILQKSDEIKEDFMPSQRTKYYLYNAKSMIKQVKDIYKNRFSAALSQPLSCEKNTKQLYIYMSGIEEGIDRILSLNGFIFNFT